jgi:hypothetical protein
LHGSTGSQRLYQVFDKDLAGSALQFVGLQPVQIVG